MSNYVYTPLPPMSNAVSGFSDTDSPIFDSFRWYHWGMPKTFKTVAEVLDYHNTHTEEIDAFFNDSPTLEAFFKNITNLRVSKVEIFIRFVRNGRVVMEPILSHRPLEDDPLNPDRKRIRGIRFATRDQGDGMPFYDFSGMADRGDYECVIYTYDRNGRYLAIRIPFRFTRLNSGDGSDGDNGGGNDGGGDGGDGGNGDNGSGDGDGGDGGNDGGDGDNGGGDPGGGDGGDGDGGDGNDGGGDGSDPGDGGDPSTPERTRVIQGYHLNILEGLTPFTKKPTTQFRPAAVATLKEHNCKSRIPTPSSEPIYRPIITPVTGVPTPPECNFSIFPRNASVPIGTEITLQFTHGNDSGVDVIYAVYNDHVVERVSDNSFKAIGVGETNISFIAQYNDGQQCEANDTLSLDVYAQCQLEINADSFTASVGETIQLDLEHGTNFDPDSSHLLSIVREYDQNNLNRVGDSYTGLSEGVFPVNYVVEYPSGLICTRTVNLTFA